MLNNKLTIHCTVTNDLNQDQRMHRICNTLYEMGHNVVLIGRKKTNSQILLTQKFIQKRLNCFFQKGLFFYAEYNIRLLFYLIFHSQNVIYSVDSDTLMAGYCAKKFKKNLWIYDAHEYFSEVPELQNRRTVKRIWTWIENLCLKNVDTAITVSPGLSKIFQQKWQKPFDVIYNVPYTNTLPIEKLEHPKKYILYQGMLNKGRGLEEMMDALPLINEEIDFVIIGEGDLSDALRQKAQNHPLAQNIKFLGWMKANDMKKWTENATLGFNLLDPSSLSYYYSLSNKFFDYMHAAVPSLNSALPEYTNILNSYDIGYIVADLNPQSISLIINSALLNNNYQEKKRNCKEAKTVFNWSNEKEKLEKILHSLVTD